MYACQTGPRDSLHDAVVQAVFRYAHDQPGISQLQVAVEPRHTVLGRKQKPFDITFSGDLGEPSFDFDERILAADVTVRCPTLGSYMSNTANNPGASLDTAVQSKLAAFAQLQGNVILPGPYVYRPWAISVYGNMHPLFIEDLRRLASLRARVALQGAAVQLGRNGVHEYSRLLTFMSYKLQLALFDFFTKRVQQCNTA